MNAVVCVAGGEKVKKSKNGSELIYPKKVN